MRRWQKMRMLGVDPGVVHGRRLLSMRGRVQRRRQTVRGRLVGERLVALWGIL